MDSKYTTERLNIREFIPEEDAPILQEYLNDKESAWNTLAMPHPLPEGMALKTIQGYLKAKREGKSDWYAVTLKDNDHLIGMVGLIFFPEHKKANIGYCLGKPYWGNGYATEAAKRMIKVGFEDLGLNRIGGGAYADNVRSCNVMERLGLKREGTLRKDWIKWGEARDSAFFGLLREEYEEMREREEQEKKKKD